jgi:hypothetical protein
MNASKQEFIFQNKFKFEVIDANDVFLSNKTKEFFFAEILKRYKISIQM